jgi:uncharacterized membrane protein
MDIKKFYNTNKIIILISIIILIISTFILGFIFLPTIFYDQFIWKYFWGPILSDAEGYTQYYNGIKSEEKFTIISEIIYGLLIITILFGLYRLLKRWNIDVNWNFCLSIMPYIIAGSVTRVLEDSGFFIKPSVYLFITPIIYFQILLIFLIFIVLGYYIQNRFKSNYLNLNSILFISGLIYLTPFIFFTIQWLIGNRWGDGNSLRYDVFFLVLILSISIIFIVYLISRYFKKNDNLSIYSRPLNLAMLGGHMIDGISSYISIYDPLNMGLPSYYEKHPASDFIMNIWPPLFPIIKFILIILVIYVFDIVYKKEFENYPRLVNLLKIGIFILGFAPGFRDLLRVLMGV